MVRTALWAAWIGILLSLTTCGRRDGGENPSDKEGIAAAAARRGGEKYLSDAAFRAETLKGSLASTENGYAKARLENYTEEKWGALPLWNPRTRPVRPGDVGAPRPTADETWRTFDASRFSWEPEALRKLGEEVFFNFPIALQQHMFVPLKSMEKVAKYGLWQTSAQVGGLVWIEVPGGVFPAQTCATCHARTDEKGDLVAGAPNHRLDDGAIRQAFARRRLPIGDWGPGRADVNPDGEFNPSVIADLRPVRFQTRLQRAALLNNSLPALAVRFETGIITGGTSRRFRPPREAMLALAYYVWSLADTLPKIPEGRGRQVFDHACGRCHAGPGLNGMPVPLKKIDTDRSVAQSPARHTGLMQLPSLRGLGLRERYFSNGQLQSLDELLSADRTVPGHRYGLDLSAKDKVALTAFLREL